MGTSEAFVGCLARRPRLVLLGALIVTLGAAPFALRLSGSTVSSFPAAPGSRSEREGQIFKSQFPGIFDDRETVYIQCSGSAEECECKPGACAGFQKIIDDMKSGLSDYMKDGTVVSIASIFDIFSDPGLLPLSGQYYNATARSMVATMTVDTDKGDKATKAAMTKAESLVKSLSKSPFTVKLNGRLAGSDASSEEVGKAIGMADGTGSVLIVLLFGYRTRSWRLTLIPFINTVISLMMTEAICYPLAISVITVPTFVPNLCMFLCIALSVDYSFFHLSRFQELRRGGSDLMQAVEGMVTTAGRVVLVSGGVLLFTWLALAFFPVFGVNSLGYCASVTIACCIFVNMIMNPAIVLAFPDFFSRAAQDPWRCCRRRAAAREAEVVDVTNNAYGKIAKTVTRMPYMVIVPLLVYAVFTPAAVKLFQADLSVGGIAGGTAESQKVADQISRDFPSASASAGAPLLVLLGAPSGAGGIEHEAYFSAGCELAQMLEQDAKLPADAFKGVMLGRPSADAVSCVHWATASKQLNESAIFRYEWQRAVNKGETSSLITVLPPFDTFSDKAKDLVDSARKTLDKFSAKMPGYLVSCYHPMAIEVDAEALTAQRFPCVITATVFVVFTAIGIRYKAALVPVKLLFTIALPILFVLGCGVFVFQDGWLNWTHIPSLQSSGGLVWLNPVACSFMLVGFALDYDLFLFSRIYEDRKKGRFLNDRDAIVNAVASTGPVITTAGIIMALAFSGMIVQHDIPFLSQMGFTMILGVLVDTFVVRTLLVPALLQAAGQLNWWPGRMPTGDDQGQGFLNTAV